MSLAILVIKALVVLFFLLMFIRRGKLIWAVGLLTVTSATLLDALFSTFSRDDMLETLGFTFYVISGGLFAGAGIWLWGVLRPLVRNSNDTAISHGFEPFEIRNWEVPRSGHKESTVVDRQLIYEQMSDRLGPDDILDIAYDLEIPENAFITANQPFGELIPRLIALAEEAGKSGELALAVERALVPLPPENLPRLEKIRADSPPTTIRHYLLANYTEDQLRNLGTRLGIDWEALGGTSKKARVRNMLLYLYRRNRVEKLIQLMQD